MAVTELGLPGHGLPDRDQRAGSVGPAQRLVPDPVRIVLNWGRRYALWVFNFGLACCAIEFIATSMARHDFIRLGVIPFAPGPRQADLMVVSRHGHGQDGARRRRLYEQMPEPKYVISFGACSNCGGPYWDSYSVTKGVDQIIPVDVYVPGCPPRPEALLQGILRLQEKIAGENLAERYPDAAAARRAASPTVLTRPLGSPAASSGTARDRAATTGRTAAHAAGEGAERRRRFGRCTVDVRGGALGRHTAGRPRRARADFFDWLSAVDELDDGFRRGRSRRRSGRRHPVHTCWCAPGSRETRPVLPTADRRLPRRGLARARDVRDVRHRLRRAPAPRCRCCCPTGSGPSAAQGLRARRPGGQAVARRQGAGRVRASRRCAVPAPDAAARRAGSRPGDRARPCGRGTRST